MLTKEHEKILREQAKKTADKYIPRKLAQPVTVVLPADVLRGVAPIEPGNAAFVMLKFLQDCRREAGIETMPVIKPLLGPNDDDIPF